MSSNITSEEFWELLTEKITLEELKARREEQRLCQEINDRLNEAFPIFTERLKRISTVNLLKMRWDCPDRLRFELFPNYPHKLLYLNYAFQQALRRVLNSRPNIPHGRDAISARRKMAQANHGSKKLKSKLRK